MKNRKKEKNKNKKERRGHTTIPFERSTLVLHLLSRVLHRDHHHAYSYVGTLLHYRTWLVYSNDESPQTSSMSIGELLAHMCIRCMAIPTPHIISIIWPSLAYDCPH